MADKFTDAEIEQIKQKAVASVQPDMNRLIALTGQPELVMRAHKITETFVSQVLIAGLNEMSRIGKVGS